MKAYHELQKQQQEEREAAEREQKEKEEAELNGSLQQLLKKALVGSLSAPVATEKTGKPELDIGVARENMTALIEKIAPDMHDLRTKKQKIIENLKKEVVKKKPRSTKSSASLMKRSSTRKLYEMAGTIASQQKRKQMTERR